MDGGVPPDEELQGPALWTVLVRTVALLSGGCTPSARLNLITPETSRRAAALIREGVTVSCPLPLNTAADVEDPMPAVHLMPRAGGVAEEDWP